MRKYQVTVNSDRYPMTYTVEGSSWGVAASRALKLWQKRFKRSSADTLKLTIIKGGIVEQSKTSE